MVADGARGTTRRRERPLAYSTGQAARYCFVTSDTILNWIHKGSLQAQRTAGGQYRIRREDLLRFMRVHGMSTELLEREQMGLESPRGTREPEERR